MQRDARDSCARNERNRQNARSGERISTTQPFAGFRRSSVHKIDRAHTKGFRFAVRSAILSDSPAHLGGDWRTEGMFTTVCVNPNDICERVRGSISGIKNSRAFILPFCLFSCARGLILKYVILGDCASRRRFFPSLRRTLMRRSLIRANPDKKSRSDNTDSLKSP